jgi:hypothetical protein
MGANGTAPSRSKLVALEWRDLGAVEEIPGTYSAITQKVIRRALELIRSRARQSVLRCPR